MKLESRQRWKIAINDSYRLVKARPLEGLACGLITLASILVYYFGALKVLPILMEDQSFSVWITLNLLAHWNFIAVMSNIVLIHIRNSSIRHRFLSQPVFKPQPPPSTNGNRDSDRAMGNGNHIDEDLELKERTKHLGQHFMATPFGEQEMWHICSVCEVFVPPRTWHCQDCKTCILRRDHHCMLMMKCIGEENHCNFLGLLFYLGFGCSYATIMNFIHQTYFLNNVGWMFFWKALVPYYTIFVDFSIINILQSVGLTGQFASWGVLFYYIHLALRGQTSADAVRGVLRSKDSKYSIQSMKDLLGPNPLLRILWPFHPVIINSYEAHHHETLDDDDDRKSSRSPVMIV